MFSSLALKLGLSAAALGALLVAFLVVHHKGYVSGKESQQSSIVALQDASRTKDETISKLKSANEAWEARYNTDLAATKAIAEAASQHAQKQQKLADSYKSRLDSIYAHDSCANAPVPSGVVDGLRNIAADHSH